MFAKLLLPDDTLGTSCLKCVLFISRRGLLFFNRKISSTFNKIFSFDFLRDFIKIFRSQ